MESAFAIAALLLFALLVGFVIPVLLQLRTTLRSAERLMETTSPKLDRALVEAIETLGRLNRVASEIETTSREARALIDRAKDVGSSLENLAASARRMGAAATGLGLGSTLIAIVRALFAPRPREAEAPAAASGSGKEMP